MGYSHSLVIARQDTEQEQEKLKKLPEYNPRTIWRAHQQWHLNPFHRAEEQPCDQQEYLTCSVATSHGIVLVGWLSWGERCSRVWRLSTHLDSQQTPQQFGHSNQRRWDWRLTCSGWSSSHNEWSRYLYFPMSLQRFVLSTSRPAKLCFPKNPFQFLFSFMSGLLILFVCFSIDSCDIYRCYSRSPRSFPTGGILKTNTPYLCLFLHVCSGYGILVYLVPRISWSILSVAVWPSVCDCCRL